MNTDKRKIYNYIEDDTLKIEQLMNDYSNYIYVIIKNMSSNITNEDVEEIMLDIFLIIWRNKNKLDINKYISSYIGGITRNLVKLRFRKLKINENIDDYENICTDCDELELNVLNNEKKQIIREELKKMKSIDREIFIEYYYKEKNIRQISNIFNMSEVGIKSRLFRIRKRIRKILKERGYDFNG